MAATEFSVVYHDNFFFSKKTMRYNNSEVVIFVSSISFKSEKGKQSSSKET